MGEVLPIDTSIIPQRVAENLDLPYGEPHPTPTPQYCGRAGVRRRSLFLSRKLKKCQIVYKINALQQNFIKNSCTLCQTLYKFPRQMLHCSNCVIYYTKGSKTEPNN